MKKYLCFVLLVGCLFVASYAQNDDQNLPTPSAFSPSEQSDFECDGAGGIFEMVLKKSSAEWSVTQIPEWMQVTEIIPEEGKVIFNVSPNPSAEPRNGVVIITSDDGKTQEYTITQKGGAEHLTVLTNHLSFDGAGGQQNVIVDANFNWEYTTSASWLQLSHQKVKLQVICSANDSVKQRNATITISGKEVSQTIMVTQSEGETVFDVTGAEDNKLSFGAAGGENNSLKVSCNDDWGVENTTSWLKITPSENAVVVQCEANPWAESRTATFELVTAFEKKSKTFTVEQKGAEPRIDKVSLPFSGGERAVSDVRPHYRSVYLKGDKGDMRVKVHSNVQTWDCQIITEDTNWIVAEASPKDSLITLKIANNNGWKAREANVIVNAMGIMDTLNVRQNNRGYKGILDDYFDGGERTWKTTRFFVDVHGAECVGIRIGGFAKRWKFVEVSLLDFNLEYAYRELAFDWNPIVRGFLPFSRNANRWAAYMGMGVAVNVLNFNFREQPMRFTAFDGAHFLFEIGAEFHWKSRENISSRIFYRYDGYSSLGISFDFYKWTKKWK